MTISYRNHYDVIAKVLQVCQDGTVSKTKIMYTAFLSYTQLQAYLQEVIKNNLIIEVNHQYVITENGEEFLKLYEKIKKLISVKQFNLKPVVVKSERNLT